LLAIGKAAAGLALAVGFNLIFVFPHAVLAVPNR
jgi:hypothetical protein